VQIVLVRVIRFYGYNKRSIEPQHDRLVEAGRDLIAHPVPPPCHAQGSLPPAQCAQSPVQPGLEKDFQDFLKFLGDYKSCSVL